MISRPEAGVQLSEAFTKGVKSGITAWQFSLATAFWVGEQLRIKGAVVSLTVKVVEQIDAFPDRSETVTVIEVSPNDTRVPAGGDCVTTRLETGVQLSEAAIPAVKSGTVAWQLALAKADCGDAQLIMTGAVVSVTVNVVMHEFWFPKASVTEIVTWVVPMDTRVPGSGVWLINSDVKGVQLSEAIIVGVKSGTAD